MDSVCIATVTSPRSKQLCCSVCGIVRFVAYLNVGVVIKQPPNLQEFKQKQFIFFLNIIRVTVNFACILFQYPHSSFTSVKTCLLVLEAKRWIQLIQVIKKMKKIYESLNTLY